MSARPRPASVTKLRGARETKEKSLPRLPPVVIQKDLAAALSITQRRVQQLLKDGVLIGNGRSSYPLAENIIRYMDVKVQAAAAQAAPTSNDGLNKRREEQLQIKIGREDRQLITMTEALATVDAMAGYFLQAISGLPAMLTRDVKERKRIEAVCDDVRQKLSDDFGQEQRALEAGIPPGEASDEDDA